MKHSLALKGKKGQTKILITLLIFLKNCFTQLVDFVVACVTWLKKLKGTCPEYVK